MRSLKSPRLLKLLSTALRSTQTRRGGHLIEIQQLIRLPSLKYVSNMAQKLTSYTWSNVSAGRERPGKTHLRRNSVIFRVVRRCDAFGAGCNNCSPLWSQPTTNQSPFCFAPHSAARTIDTVGSISSVPMPRVKGQVLSASKC